MGFDITRSSQSVYFILSLHANLYEGASSLAKNNKAIMPWVALPIGIASELLNVVQPVAQLAESLLKGTLNIVGSPFFPSRCQFSRGLKQLVVQTICAVATALFRTIGALSGVFSATKSMFFDPVNFANRKSEEFRGAIQKQVELQKKYDDAIATLESNPNNTDALHNLFSACLGSETNGGDLPSPVQAFKKSAAADCAAGHLFLGMTYFLGLWEKVDLKLADESFKAAFETATRALDASPTDNEALLALSLLCKTNRLDDEKKQEAFVAFQKSAKADYPRGHFVLGLAYYHGWGCEKNYESAGNAFKAAIASASPSKKPDFVKLVEPYLLAVLAEQADPEPVKREMSELEQRCDPASLKEARKVLFAGLVPSN